MFRSRPAPLDPLVLTLAVGLAAAVGLTAFGCLEVPKVYGRVAPIWFANALLVATLIRSRRRRWPVFGLFALAGFTAANMAASDDPLLAALSFGACNVAESTVCAMIVRQRCGLDFDMARMRHLLWFSAAAMIASLLAACAASLLLAAFKGGGLALRDLLSWAQADILGLLTLGSGLLAATSPRRKALRPLLADAWTLLVPIIVSAAVFYVMRYPLLFLIGPALMLPTWRMGLPGAICGLLIVAVLGTASTLVGLGPFALAQGVDRVTGLQLFLAISFFATMPLAVVRDESERLKAKLVTSLEEAERLRLEAEAAASVKAEFLANMSHELRTPLTSIIGFTRLAADQPELSGLSRGYVERVADASSALLSTVNDVLDFSKLEAGQVSFEPKPTSIYKLARGTLDLFGPQAAAKEIQLELVGVAASADHRVLIDPDRLRQVLLNLVGNAVKFTAAGDVRLAVAYDVAAQRLRIEVADSGPGIAPDKQHLLFMRFSQVDGSLTRAGGTGLGLAICKGLVDAMGGRIGVSSTPGEGSLFWFEVPAPLAGGAEGGGADAQETVVLPGLRVLVADDHAVNRELARLILQGVGAEVAEAEDGERAAQMAAATPYDVILLDVRMPRLDGPQALRRIRAEDGPNDATPILAFTADAEVAQFADLGFQGVVAKPVQPGALIAAVAQAVAWQDDPPQGAAHAA